MCVSRYQKSVSLPPSLHVAMANFYFSDLARSLPFYNQGLKTRNCLFSSGSAMLVQWSRSSSKEPHLISHRRPLHSQPWSPPSLAKLPAQASLGRTLSSQRESAGAFFLPFSLWSRIESAHSPFSVEFRGICSA